MKKIFLISNLFVSILFTSFLFVNDVSAQTCQGSQSCCPVGALQEVCLPINCKKGQPGCTCTQDCLGGEVTQACSFRAGVCSTSWLPADCDYKIGSCSVVNPPTAPPTAPPASSCSSGDPFVGIPNCGSVGRTSGSGSCGAGCLCCLPPGNPGGGFTGCTFFGTVPGSVTVDVGATKDVHANPYAYNGVPVTWSAYSVSASNAAIATAGRLGGGNLCCNTAYGYLDNTALPLVHGVRVRGIAVGNTTVTVHTSISDGQNCRISIPVRVTAPVLQCSQPTVTATPACSLTPGGNASVTFRWNYVANADQYDFYVVDTATGTTIAGTDTGFQPGNSATFNFCNSVGSNCTHVVSLPQGSVNYEGRVIARSSLGTCSDSTFSPSNNFPVAVCAATAWWQSGSGDIITQGNVSSTIPASITSPDNRVSLDGSAGYPGVIMTSTSGSVDPGTGVVSSKNWVISGQYSSRVPSYANFLDLTPLSITPVDPAPSGSTVSGGYFNNNGGVANDSEGYSWYRHVGDLTITSDINLTGSRKIILFVQGNLTINGKISLDPQNQYFMAIVGAGSGGSGGNISVGPTVTTIAGTPTLTGIFYAEGQFRTGAGTGPFSLLGSVAATNGVILQRDLAGFNITQASEVFDISPDLLIGYPPTLTFKRPIWQEIAP